eukprot:5082410-Prymnesium_polylepis.3
MPLSPCAVCRVSAFPVPDPRLQELDNAAGTCIHFAPVPCVVCSRLARHCSAREGKAVDLKCKGP